MCDEEVETMRPLILDLLFNDDRAFVLGISRSTVGDPMSTDAPQWVWSIITRRNVPGYPPVKANWFSSHAEALAYYRKVVVETPRVSLGRKSPEPAPSLDAYQAWLIAEDLFDPVLNPTASVRKRD